MTFILISAILYQACPQKDNPVSTAELDSNFPGVVEITPERNMPSSTTTTEDNDVKYLDVDPENLFVEFVSDVKNYGLFAKTSFQRGDFVVVYRGTRLTREKNFEKTTDYLQKHHSKGEILLLSTEELD